MPFQAYMNTIIHPNILHHAKAIYYLNQAGAMSYPFREMLHHVEVKVKRSKSNGQSQTVKV